MRKRERENPCTICGHYHKYDEGEVCGICGHRMHVSSDTAAPQALVITFPSEILPEFLYLGSYDESARTVHLRTRGISHLLNTDPRCRNLYRSSITYHNLDNEKVLQFVDAIKFLDQCEKDKARVLVHCISGKSRSPAVVIAYLMKLKGWRLAESHQWVKQQKPIIDISPEFFQQLQEFEQSIFPKIDNQAQAHVFNNAHMSSIFSSPASTPPKPITGCDITIDGS